MRRSGLALLLPILLACASAPPGPTAGPPPVPTEDRADAPPVPAIAWGPRQYACPRLETPPEIDGQLNDTCWRAAPWTEPFVDIEGDAKPRPWLRTRAKMGWDDTHLYVAAEIEEPHVWATLVARDSVIYHDNDFEVFLDPDGDTHAYMELEINAFGTEWDLLLVRPYRDGGPAVHAWDIPGLKSAVAVRGTINDPGDLDRGWTVEIAFPFAGLAECAGTSCPPNPGDVWRMNFSRVQWKTRVEGESYVKETDIVTGQPLPENNWVWSPQGLVNLHYPEMWGFVRFVGDDPGEATAPPDDATHAAWALRLVYYRQRDHFQSEGRYTTNLGALGLEEPPVPGVSWPPTISVTPHGFEASVERTGEKSVRIDHEGRVR